MGDKKDETTINEDMEELKGIKNTHLDLCQELHNNMDNIPKNVKDKIWDMVYSYFEP